MQNKKIFMKLEDKSLTGVVVDVYSPVRFISLDNISSLKMSGHSIIKKRIVWEGKTDIAVDSSAEDSSMIMICKQENPSENSVIYELHGYAISEFDNNVISFVVRLPIYDKNSAYVDHVIRMDNNGARTWIKFCYDASNIPSFCAFCKDISNFIISCNVTKIIEIIE